MILIKHGIHVLVCGCLHRYVCLHACTYLNSSRGINLRLAQTKKNLHDSYMVMVLNSPSNSKYKQEVGKFGLKKKLQLAIL